MIELRCLACGETFVVTNDANTHEGVALRQTGSVVHDECEMMPRGRGVPVAQWSADTRLRDLQIEVHGWERDPVSGALAPPGDAEVECAHCGGIPDGVLDLTMDETSEHFPPIDDPMPGRPQRGSRRHRICTRCAEEVLDWL